MTEAQRLADECKRLAKWHAMNGDPGKSYPVLEAAIDKLASLIPAGGLAEEARDAARYRWLRAQHWSDKTLTVANPNSVGLGCMTYGREGLDAAIDAALSAPTHQQEQPR